MPRHVVDLVAEALNDRGMALKGARVGVVGVAFKPNVRDARNSPAAGVIAGLLARGASVDVPRPARRHGSGPPTAASIGECQLDELVDGSDVVVVVTAHRSIDWARLFDRAELVVDTVDSSRGRSLRPRQVLRLGAGWSARA